MADKSKIPWLDGGSTWNPLRGCFPVSPGCRNCYARQMAYRFRDSWGEGLTDDDGQWTGAIHVVPERFADPLRWRKGRLIFPCSGADLFHPNVDFQTIALMWAIMAMTKRHRYLVLTKRAEALVSFIRWMEQYSPSTGGLDGPVGAMLTALDETNVPLPQRLNPDGEGVPRGTVDVGWPLSNVGLGVTVESERYLHRVEKLLEVDAAFHWVSAEPLLGRLDGLAPFLYEVPGQSKLAWVVVGGESCNTARPCQFGWLRGVVQHVQRAEGLVYVKQAGSAYVDTINGVAGRFARVPAAIGTEVHRLKDWAGRDPDEWPEVLRVRDPAPFKE